ncbi:MAG: DUF4097 family beta strand repeat protein [candidate division WOR-3 bacterium]|nr:MAG: DUF4097 family beta strand repeat protein [candidate division WOR-3 bacterium]
MISAFGIMLVIGHLSCPSVGGMYGSMMVGFFEKTEEFQETYRVSPDTRLTIENINGDIKIIQWSEDHVEVYAQKKTNHGQEELDKVRIDVTTDGILRVRTEYLEEKVRASVHYVLSVPSDVVVDLVKTSNGCIDLEEIQGDTEIVTSNGDVNLQHVTGSVLIQTANGEIQIKGKTMVREASTSNGDIRIDIHGVPEGGSTIATSNGSIDLYVSDGLNADLRGATSQGKISTKGLALQSRFNATAQSATFVTGEVGAGGNLIDLSTSNGDVRLYRLDK